MQYLHLLLRTTSSNNAPSGFSKQEFTKEATCTRDPIRTLRERNKLRTCSCQSIQYTAKSFALPLQCFPACVPEPNNLHVPLFNSSISVWYGQSSSVSCSEHVHDAVSRPTTAIQPPLMTTDNMATNTECLERIPVDWRPNSSGAFSPQHLRSNL